MLDTALVTRYVSPLREGGSLPGIVEADDLGTYVMKFHGAGQGAKALVAEVVVGELARRLGLRVPRLCLLELHSSIARYEPDQEVQDLLSASVGLNLGVDFLPGSFGYEVTSFRVDPQEGARIMWLDGFVANIDRSWQNPNLLVWHKNMWCIDHGAALYFHHSWQAPSPEMPDDQLPDDDGAARFAAQHYSFDKHIMSPHIAVMREADPSLADEISRSLLEEVLSAVPDAWLDDRNPGVVRKKYVDYLYARAQSPRRWLVEAS